MDTTNSTDSQLYNAFLRAFLICATDLENYFAKKQDYKNKILVTPLMELFYENF